MKISGWGNYPKIDACIRRPASIEAVIGHLHATDSFIVRGLGRSYGDSSLNHMVLSLGRFKRMLSFDVNEGILSCESGVSLKEILDTFVPRGWFLPVTPGTKYVTLGGAIASDVHGKNHHKDGSFSDHLLSMDVMTSEGKTVTCSRAENADLFKATCGGMGLTGIILSASFKLKRIETAYIKQMTIRARNIEETMDLFEQYGNCTYSVAWIDCLSRNDTLGRSILMLGEHAESEDIRGLSAPTDPLRSDKKQRLTIPIHLPNWLLNSVTARGFNFLYYHRHPNRVDESIVDYNSFFYPLDRINNWNRIYGSRGFTQYQFVLPYTVSKQGLKRILRNISTCGMGSFLAVLKLFGKGNDNLLSFPMAGYTLALDFPIMPGLFPFLDELDRIVMEYGGRLYLSKDVRMGKDMFSRSYQNAERFKNTKNRIDRNNTFQSFQSQRLGI